MLCVVMVLFIFLMIFIKDGNYTEYLIANANDSIQVSEGDVVIQTWLSDIQRVNGVGIEFAQSPLDDVDIMLEVIDTDSGIIYGSDVKNTSEITDGLLLFEFDVVDIKLSTNIVIKLSIINSTGEVSRERNIKLKTNHHHSGMTINDIAQNEGLCLQIKYLRNSLLFTVLWFGGIIFILACSLMVLFKKTFFDTVGITVLLLGMILYVFGRINICA